MATISSTTQAITIAPLGDDEDDDIITQETPGRNATDVTSGVSPTPIIKCEPIDITAAPVTTATSTRSSNITVPLLPSRVAGGAGITIAPSSGIRNLVPVSRGVFRFSTVPSTVTARAALTGKSPGSGSVSQPMFLIPANMPRQQLSLRPSSPFKLIPIQPKKSQAVVAPQAKTVVVQAAPSVLPQTVVQSFKKGIISFSSENPDDFVIGRPDTIINPKYLVSGMIFNSRTVTGGGRVKYTKDYLCNVCKHMSDSYPNFKAHFTSAHMFNCDYCTFKAFSRYEVVLHTKSTHMEAIEDLKGYEMFEEGDAAPVTVTTVSPPVTMSSILTSASAGSITHTSKSPSSSGLITVPVLGMKGDKLILQSRHQTTTSQTTASTVTATSTATAKVSDSSIGSYFTYKIVYGSKTDPKKYECDLCQFQTPNLVSMYEHASSHTMSDLSKSSPSSTTWECFYCNFKSNQQAIVVKHVSAAHPSKHIQLKRYTTTSVIKPLSSTNTSPSVDLVTGSGTAAKSNTTVVSPGNSLVIRPLENSESDTIMIPSPTEDGDGSKDSSVDVLSKAKEKGKTSKDVEEEDDGTAMWGCYYCEHEDRDRHDVVAHVKAEHAGRKIVITRRRLPSKDSKDSAGDKETSTETVSKDSDEEKEGPRKNYESLIIKLRRSNKSDTKTTLEIKGLLGRQMSGTDDSHESDGLASLPSLMKNIENANVEASCELSGGEGNDLEMPILEPMVSGRKSPRSPRREMPKSPIQSAEFNRHRPGPKSKKIMGTRVKSDLAFDQAEVVFLDHVPEDLKIDVSQLYVFNKNKQEAKCNICHRKYTGKMAYGHMREHLMIHTGERIWGCPYCAFRCNRRFVLYMHVKKIHPDLPIKLVRRRPYQVSMKPDSRGSSGSVTFNVSEPNKEELKVEPTPPKLRGPRSHREKEFLKTAEVAWLCPYCSRKDVFKGAIKIHMKMVHPDKDYEAEPSQCERPLDLLHKLTAENQLPLKEAKIQLFRYEDMDRYKILQETLEENGRNLLLEMDLEGSKWSIPLLKQLLTEDQEKKLSKPNILSHAKYQCPYCSTRGIRPSTVKIHMMTCHKDKELYIRDLRVSRKTQGQDFLYVCSDPECKFMTYMKQALYAHIAKNPTHIKPGVGEEDVLVPADLANVLPRATSLRRKPEVKLDENVPSSTPAPLMTPTEEKVEMRSPPSTTTIVLDNEPLPQKPAVQKPPYMVVFPKQKSIKPDGGKKKKRVKPPLPSNHRDGVDITGIQMLCKYCDMLPTDDWAMMKEHLVADHNTLVPIAVDVRQKDLRKSSRIHICQMTDCTYATYFEEAFSIHLSEVHSEVRFPFRQILKIRGDPCKERKPAVSKPKSYIRERNPTPPPPDIMPISPEPVLEAESANEDSENSTYSWETPASKHKKRKHRSSDEEPEWRPNRRKPKKRLGRVQKSTVIRKKPNSNSGDLPPPPLQHMLELDTVTAGAESQSPEINWSNEGIGAFPSAQAAVKTRRFKCTYCATYASMIQEIKDHMHAKHSKHSVFCLDMHAKHMRKRQTIFMCVEMSCTFVCKSWRALRYHLEHSHAGEVSAQTVLELDDVMTSSPLMRNKSMKSKAAAQSASARSVLDLDTPVNKPEISKSSGLADNQDAGDSTDTSPDTACTAMDVNGQVSAPTEPRKRKGKPHRLVRRTEVENLDSDTEEEVADAGEVGKDEGENKNEENQEVQDDKEDSVKSDKNEDEDVEDNSDDDDEEEEEDGDDDDDDDDDGDGDGDGNSKGDDKESDDDDGDTADDEEEEADDKNESSSDSSKEEDSSDAKSTPEKKDSEGQRSLSDSPDEKKVLAKDNGDVPNTRATMDAMYQCSHCTYLSTDKENIQAHLIKEHSTMEAEYTQIGAEFSYDGRVNMSVGEVESDALSKPSEEHQSKEIDSSPDKKPSVSRIQPLKLTLKTKDIFPEASGDNPQKRKSELSESDSEQSPKKIKSDKERQDDEEDDDDDEDDDDEEEEDSDSKDESSSGTSSSEKDSGDDSSDTDSDSGSDSASSSSKGSSGP